MKRFLWKATLVAAILLMNVGLPVLGGLIAAVFAFTAESRLATVCWASLIGVNLVNLLTGIITAASDISGMVPTTE